MMATEISRTQQRKARRVALVSVREEIKKHVAAAGGLFADIGPGALRDEMVEKVRGLECFAGVSPANVRRSVLYFLRDEKKPAVSRRQRKAKRNIDARVVSHGASPPASDFKDRGEILAEVRAVIEGTRLGLEYLGALWTLYDKKVDAEMAEEQARLTRAQYEAVAADTKIRDLQADVRGLIFKKLRLPSWEVDSLPKNQNRRG